MKIFYINVIEQNSGWGAEWFVNRGFTKNQVEVINLDYRQNKNFLPQKLRELKDDFDVMLLQRGDGFPLQLIKAINRPRFFWASELVSRNWDQNRLFKSGLFNHVFVRGDECKKIILEKKWLKPEQISILLSGFDENIHHPTPDIIKDLDIVFVGSITKRRRQYLDILKKCFKINEFSVFGEEMVKIFNRAKIVLNVHAENFLDTETRIFEAIGCGSFIISEKLSSENPFKSSEHLVEVKNIEEMIKKIEYYLKNETERKKIAEQGHLYGLAEHTYQVRAKYLEGIMNSYIKIENKEKLPAINYKLIKFFPFEQKLLEYYYCIYNLYWLLKRKIKHLFL